MKNPLETSVALDTLDFEEFSAEEKVHIAISVKDFRAIVLHAETLRTSIEAYYSSPTRPMQLAYQENGMRCEFTLMTIGDFRGASLAPAPISTRQSSARPMERLSSRQTSTSPVQNVGDTKTHSQTNEAMPPPTQPASRNFARESQVQAASRSFNQETLSQRTQRPSPPPPKASLDPETLFMPAGDDDRQWDEKNYEDDEGQLGWDPSVGNVGSNRKGRLSIKLT